MDDASIEDPKSSLIVATLCKFMIVPSTLVISKHNFNMFPVYLTGNILEHGFYFLKFIISIFIVNIETISTLKMCTRKCTF